MIGAGSSFDVPVEAVRSPPFLRVLRATHRVSTAWMLRPLPARDMACIRVSKLINHAQNDGSESRLPG